MSHRSSAILILLTSFLLPVHAHADTDKDRSSPGAFVKDSVITAKIKAKLASEKLASAVHIKVDTDDKGIVQLTGTATDQAEVDRAGAIASGTEGVREVRNQIQVSR